MPLITVDLTKSPEIAELVSDMSPGAKVYGCFTVKSRDDQTLTLRIAEMTDKKADLPEPDAYSDDDEDGDEAKEEGIDTNSEETTEKAAKKPGASLAKKLTAAANPAEY